MITHQVNFCVFCALQTLQHTLDWLDSWERSVEYPEEFLTKSTGNGLRVTIKSTIDLCKDLLNSGKFKFVLTSKMNQDCLEVKNELFSNPYSSHFLCKFISIYNYDFQQFFGMIRRQNDHPCFMTFSQLYNLLSIYCTVKPPKYGNCTVRESEQKKITLADILKSHPLQKQSCRSMFIAKLKERVDKIIETSEWECEEIIDELSDSSLDEVQGGVVYYITGYVCKNMYAKYEECNDCQRAFPSRHENLIYGCEQANLVNVKSRGGLIHPNVHLFKLFLNLEKHFEKSTKTQEISKFIYNEVVDGFFNENNLLTFPCEIHKEDVISYCMHYYLQMRMRQYVRQVNRDAEKKYQQKKKVSKHYNK